jgi:hypothetical protein
MGSKAFSSAFAMSPLAVLACLLALSPEKSSSFFFPAGTVRSQTRKASDLVFFAKP